MKRRNHPDSVTPPLDTEPSPAQSDRPRARKRQRVSVACRSCRARKSRCDGAQPCSTCEDMASECLYEQPCSQPVTTRKSQQANDLRAVNLILEQRLQAIEHKMQLLTRDKVYRTPDLSTESTQSEAEENNRTPTIPGMVESLHLEDGVDGMGSVVLKEGAHEEEHFGLSSNVSFLRFIIHVLGHPANSTADSTFRPCSSISELAFNAFLSRPDDQTQTAIGSQQVRVQPYSLPPPHEADALLRLYFTTVNLMIPCIHENSFRDTYKKMQNEGIKAVPRSWLGVLNVVFAIATNVMTATSPTHERAMRARAFFDQAVEVVRGDILGRPSIGMVQLFFLMESYLERTTSSSLAWTFHSLAVKGAYQLGLHLTGSKSLSEIDREVRRRLWYCCVMNDRSLSATYGRPPLIPPSHVRLEISTQIPFSNVSSNVTVSSLGHFDAVMSLSHIIGDGIEHLYDQNLGHHPHPPTSETLEQISRLCWKLAQWQDSLPTCLRILTSQETLDDVPLTLGTARLRVLLSLRYLGARVLILRPLLCQFLDPPGITSDNEHQSSWLRNVGAVLLADLVRTCTDTLHISANILASSKKDQNLLGAWWLSCYYTFNSSLAILGVLLIKRIPVYSDHLAMMSIVELRSHLDLAMQILHGLDKGNKIIMQCRDTLTRLLNALDSNVNSTDLAPAAFSLSPSSAWAWQLMDPGLFVSEASLSLAPGYLAEEDQVSLSGGVSNGIGPV